MIDDARVQTWHRLRSMLPRQCVHLQEFSTVFPFPFDLFRMYIPKEFKNGKQKRGDWITYNLEETDTTGKDALADMLDYEVGDLPSMERRGSVVSIGKVTAFGYNTEKRTMRLVGVLSVCRAQ